MSRDSSGCVVVASAAVVLLLNASARGQAPPNDLCADALPLSPGTIQMTNVGAGTDGPGASCTFPWNDVWYDYVADFNGEVTINTVPNFEFDTVLVVYEGCGCDPLGPEIACNDDAIGVDAQVIFPVVDGQCYKVLVAGASFLAQGSGPLNLWPYFSQCGAPFTGSCWTANGTPACHDSNCCFAVCNIDPFCCQVEWDENCRAAAVDVCGPGPCPCDLDHDDTVNVDDLLAVLAAWGTPAGDCTGDGITNVDDLLALLADWGPCPDPACDDCTDGTLDPCPIPGDCFEVVDADGNCYCGDLSLPCDQYEPCLDGTCPDGFVCAVNTCCGGPICVPLCEH